MNKQRRRPMLLHTLGGSPRLSRGFTLIEMLISVALVLLMMVLFAEIFGLASESMTLQQAIADGDQQVRSFTTVFRSDIQKRTFQTLVPFDSQEDVELAGVPFSDRQGYLYISLNDPENATDNHLQFTVRSTIVDENDDDTEYFGKSTGIVQQNPAIAAGIASQNVRRNRQQPEHDDGDLSNNFTASSSAAEISYFMRAGRLYRRVVLIREPLISSGTNSAQPKFTFNDSAGGGPLATPKEYLRHNDFSTAPLVQTVGGQYLKYDPATGSEPSDDYWLDFDHGAYQAIAEVPPSGSGTLVIDGANMVGVSQLDNSRLTGNAPALGNKLAATFDTTSAPTQFLGVRCTRFGFDQTTGISREFSHASPSVPGFSFIGRFTLEEMSHPRFNFPQNPAIDSGGAVIGNPMSYANFPAAVDAGLFPNGAVDEFEGGTRRGQDLLLSNVHEFDVDIWDDSLGAFVKLGHQLSWSEDRNNNGALDPGEDFDGNGALDTFPGDYHRFRNNQLQAGLIDVPGNSAAWSVGQFSRWTGRTFDTWHPRADLDGDAATNDWVPPPYRAMKYYPPASPSGPYASRGAWQPSTPGSPTNYAAGDIVFPSGNSGVNYSADSKPGDHSFYYVCIDAGASLPTEDVNGDGILDASEDANCNGVLDPGEDANMNGVLDLGEDTIRCNGLIDTNEPIWPAIDRAIVERSFPGSGEPRWVARRNVKPLRAIRIRVRFFHESSGRMRQVSLVHSLVDEDRF